jgi:4,5-DOPA dioxygenase extradiol
MVIEDCPARGFLQQLGQKIGRPEAILCISAHWTTGQPAVTMHPQPPTIHDFAGFADELFTMQYQAPGDPLLAARVISLLASNEIAVERHLSRGFDHGVWSPLILMYPDADIPVVQLSVQPQLDPAHHMAMGKALQPLRSEGVLILASGAATHNLRDFFGQPLESEPLPYASMFADWLKDCVVNGNTGELLDYLNRAPEALRNHPTPEHFLPLFVALGAGGGKGTLLHDSFTYGCLSMAAFEWS